MSFYRKVESVLKSNFNDENAKILIIDGARQIGKSFIIRQTAKSMFAHYVEINLKDDYEGEKLFQNVHTTSLFYLQLSALYGNNLGSVQDTIIFLDEIQAYPHLLTMLKALKQEHRFRFVCSGSLLGITLKHSFIPMGSIQELKMYPMDFEEFLIAKGTGKEVIDFLKDAYLQKRIIPDSIHQIMLHNFREYLISGGLPDSVTAFVIGKNMFEVRENQSQTYSFYKDDATRYDELHSLKTRRIYDSLTSYMENKVKRVMAKKIDGKSNISLTAYEDEFDYLINAGIVLYAHAVSDPRFPLNESVSKNLIKLYYDDVGILSNLLFKTNIRPLMEDDKGTNLGAVYETAVAMELKAHGHELYYFDSKKVGEVDFLINDYESSGILPIEVKSGNDQNNFRAIPKLVDKDGNYKLRKGIILGNKNIVEEKGNLLTLPIYMVMFL